MDEINLFGALRPQPADDLTAHRERARARLEARMSGSGAQTRRFAGLSTPSRKAVAVSGAALAMGGAVVLPVVFSPGQSGGGSLVTSAWAVQASKDGTVKLTIKDASNPAGLQRALRAAGVNAVVVSPREISLKGPRGWVTIPKCGYQSTGPLFASAAVQRAVVTLPRPGNGPVVAYIHPAAMPARSVLFVVDTFEALPNGSRELSVTPPAVLKGHKLPRCVAQPVPVPMPVKSLEPVATPSSSPVPVPVPTKSLEPVATPSGSPVPVPAPSTPASPTATPIPSGTPTTPAGPTPIPSGTPTRTVRSEPTPTPS